MKKNLDVYVGICLMIFSVLILIYSVGLPPARFDPLGMAFIPRIFAIFLLFLGAKLTYDNWGNAPQEIKFKKIFLLSIAFALYVLFLSRIGFLFATILGLSFMMFIIREPEDKTSWKIIILTSVIVATLVYVVFTYGFKVYLP